MHEVQRVFLDRFVDIYDRTWFKETLSRLLFGLFKQDIKPEEIETSAPTFAVYLRKNPDFSHP